MSRVGAPGRTVLAGELLAVLVGFGRALEPAALSVVECWRHPTVGGALCVAGIVATTLSLPVVAWIITRRMAGGLAPWPVWLRHVTQLATGLACCGSLSMLLIALCGAALGASVASHALCAGATFVASLEQVGYVCVRSQGVGCAARAPGPRGR